MYLTFNSFKAKPLILPPQPIVHSPSVSLSQCIASLLGFALELPLTLFSPHCALCLSANHLQNIPQDK